MSQRAYKLRSAVDEPAAAARAETVLIPDGTAVVEKDDRDAPYRYGWRERREIAPDGSERLAWSPLTYRDLLDPREGDVVAESTIHRRSIADTAW